MPKKKKVVEPEEVVEEKVELEVEEIIEEQAVQESEIFAGKKIIRKGTVEINGKVKDYIVLEGNDETILL